MPEVNFIFVSEMIDEKKLQKSNSKLIKEAGVNRSIRLRVKRSL